MLNKKIREGAGGYDVFFGGGGDTKNSVAHDYVLEFYVESSSG